MAHDLPPALRAAIDEITRGERLVAVRSHAARLSQAYRAGQPSSGAVLSDSDVAAYLTARLPATFAAVAAALAELDALHPGFRPASLLDLGCGPGTAICAALNRFPSLERMTGLDHNPRFLGAARALIDATGFSEGRDLRLIAADVSRNAPPEAADLVIAAYALVEFMPETALAIAMRLWAATGHALVLVEPGSRAGFQRLRAARAALLAAGATVLAPCTHANPCPLAEPDWCHVSVRLARSRAHRTVKSADAPFEDEKFSYLVAVRTGDAPGGSRIIAPVRHGKAGHVLRLCTPAGVSERTVGPRDPTFKRARKWQWGDRVDPDEA